MHWTLALALPVKLIQAHPRLLAQFTLASLGRAATAGAAILLIREYLGGVLDRQGSGAALWTLAALLLITTLAGAALMYASRVTQQGLVRAIEVGILERLIRTLLGLSASFHDTRSRGDLVQTMQQDVAHLRTVTMAWGALVLDAMHAIALAGAAFILSPSLALLAFLLVPLGAAPIYLLAGRVMRRSRGVRRRSVALLDMLIQLLAAIRVLRIYQGEGVEAQRVVDRARSYHDELVAMERVRALAQVGLESIAGIGLVIVIIVGGLQVLDGALGWPEMLAFLIAVRAAHSPIYGINTSVLEIQRHAASVAQIDALLAEQPDVQDRPGARPLTPSPQKLSVEGLTYIAGGTTILRDVSFEVRAGETLGVVGPSGAGKTTLLNLIARFYDPQAGSVRYDGTDVRDFLIGSVHRHIALVMQDPFLFSTSIRENIRCGRPGADDRAVAEAAQAAGIHDDILAMQEGYETTVGHGARPLSRGEAQRICIARAILKDAPVLLLDEATSSLDAATEALVQRALDRLAAGRLTVAVAHHASALRSAARILVLDRGQMVGLGTHEQLLKECATYRSLRETKPPVFNLKDDQARPRSVLVE